MKCNLHPAFGGSNNIQYHSINIYIYIYVYNGISFSWSLAPEAPTPDHEGPVPPLFWKKTSTFQRGDDSLGENCWFSGIIPPAEHPVCTVDSTTLPPPDSSNPDATQLHQALGFEAAPGKPESELIGLPLTPSRLHQCVRLCASNLPRVRLLWSFVSPMQRIHQALRIRLLRCRSWERYGAW